MDEDGRPVAARDPRAVKWCALGGIHASDELPWESLLENCLKRIDGVLRGRRLTTWNDSPWRTQVQVIELLQEAEARALAKERT